MKKLPILLVMLPILLIIGILLTGCSLLKPPISLDMFNKKVTDIQASLLRAQEMNFKAQAEVTGYKTETKTEARDIINDTSLMTKIFEGLFALMTTVCAGLFVALKMKEKHLQNLIKSNSSKEDKLNDWQNKFIQRLYENGKAPHS